MQKYLSIFFIILGIICIIYCVISCFYTVARIGSIIIGLFGIFLLLFTCFYLPIQSLRVHKIFNITYLVSLSLLIILLISFLITCIVITRSAIQKPDPNADAIIVLGAGLRGERVSKSLAHRLDVAATYHLQNPSSCIVVSGGQGSNEIIPESLAMKNYLLYKYDIKEDAIIEESRSTRTLENFQFSKAILDQKFTTEYSTIYVTNDFHIYRSGKIAHTAGLDSQGLASLSVPYLIPNFYVREYLALIKFWLLDAND